MPLWFRRISINFRKYTNEGEVEVKAGRILQAFYEPFQFDGLSLKVTGSIGVSVYPNDGTNSASLIKKADNAMYRIKREGKNNFTRDWSTHHHLTSEKA